YLLIFCFSLLGRAGLLRDLIERGLIEDGEVAQDLAIETDVALLQRVHEARVGRARLARGRVDAGDPEAAEGALAALAVGVGVDPRLANDFLRVGEEARASAVEALRVLEHAVATAASLESSFCAGHCVLSSFSRKAAFASRASPSPSTPCRSCEGGGD